MWFSAKCTWKAGANSGNALKTLGTAGFSRDGRKPEAKLLFFLGLMDCYFNIELYNNEPLF